MRPRTTLQAISEGLESGKMTMRQAQEKLYFCGWFNYVPSPKQVMTTINGWREFTGRSRQGGLK